MPFPLPQDRAGDMNDASECREVSLPRERAWLARGDWAGTAEEMLEALSRFRDHTDERAGRTARAFRQR